MKKKKQGNGPRAVEAKLFELKQLDSAALWVFATSKFAHEYYRMMALELLAWRAAFPGYSIQAQAKAVPKRGRKK